MTSYQPTDTDPILALVTSSPLLTEKATPMNPGREWVSPEIVVHKRGRGRWLSVRVAVAWHSRPGQSVEHESLPGHWDLSISGSESTAASRNRGDVVSGGQIRSSFMGLDLPGITEFRRAWSEFHLNGMTAGCPHVEPVIAPDHYGRQVPSLDLTPACPETGYRYGHGWLVRPLPADVVAAVLDFLTHNNLGDLWGQEVSA